MTAAKTEETSDIIVTRGGVEISRTRTGISYAGAIDAYIDGLDSRRGAVFSSNYEYPGRYTRWDTAIINPPQAMILSIGTISNQPVVNEHNQIVPGQRMWIGMSCDHRVVDGAIGAKYLSELKRFLESPVLLVS